MTFAKRIEFFDGQGLRQTCDAFVVSMAEMETVKALAREVVRLNRSYPRLTEFAENWEASLPNVRNLITGGTPRKRDGRLCPQYNTERKVERFIYENPDGTNAADRIADAEPPAPPPLPSREQMELL